MAESEDLRSLSDPHRAIDAKNNRDNSLRPVSTALTRMFSSQMPEEVRKRIMLDQHVKKSYAQFGQVTDEFILRHVNSVYLMRSKVIEGAHDLVVYVDNSTIAAELNARRELIRLKYREKFNLVIDAFEIRISKGEYLKKRPYSEGLIVKTAAENPLPELSAEESERVDAMLAGIGDPRLKASFKAAITASKRRKKLRK